MPFIQITTNGTVSQAQKSELQAGCYTSMQVIPGKENWLMVSVVDEQPLWFKQDEQAPTAFLEVNLFGTLEDDAAQAITQKLTDVVQGVLSISPERIYIMYKTTPHWGWNGANFKRKK